MLQNPKQKLYSLIPSKSLQKGEQKRGQCRWVDHPACWGWVCSRTLQTPLGHKWPQLHPFWVWEAPALPLVHQSLPPVTWVHSTEPPHAPEEREASLSWALCSSPKLQTHFYPPRWTHDILWDVTMNGGNRHHPPSGRFGGRTGGVGFSRVFLF